MPRNAPTYLRPGALDRIFGHMLVLLVRIGLVRGYFYVLEVRGRKTGRTISLPVDPLDLDGQRYLVCARGNSNWVRNARTAGEVVLVRAIRRRRYLARELPPDMRPPILKAYLDRFAGEVQRFFPVPKGSAVEAFDDLAPRYPVFALQPLTKPARVVGDHDPISFWCSPTPVGLRFRIAAGNEVCAAGGDRRQRRDRVTFAGDSEARRISRTPCNARTISAPLATTR